MAGSNPAPVYALVERYGIIRPDLRLPLNVRVIIHAASAPIQFPDPVVTSSFCDAVREA
jgi:hypothetical protein